MDETTRIEKVLKAAEVRVQDEVAGLLGTDFTLVGEECTLLSKAEVFRELRGKQVCVLLDCVGDVRGDGCLLVGIKDAIRLGGTLIMLPDAELEEACGREDYTNEIADSYAEIANIITGSITKEFAESYPHPCRLIRKEQDVIVPAKIDIESDRPIQNETYCVFAGSMTLEGRSLGRLWLLLPAAGFGLQATDPETIKEQSAPPETEPTHIPVDNARPAVDADTGPEQGEQAARVAVTPEPANAASAGAKASGPSQTNLPVAEHKEKIDRLLDRCREKIGYEVGKLLNVAVELPTIENRILDKKDVFADALAGRQVLAKMEVVGDRQDSSHLFISLRDAIHLGGILIMLPPGELESTVQEEDFGDDANDAYTEVVNTIAGVYTAVFEELYAEKLRFIRKEVQQVMPAEVATDSDEPIQNRAYYCSTMRVVVEQQQLGAMHMLLPVEMLHLESLVAAAEAHVAAAAPATSGQQKSTVEQPPQQNPGKPLSPPATGVSKQGTGKERAQIDKLLSLCRQRLQEEVGGLLGMDVGLSESRNMLLTKEEFFHQTVAGRQVMVNMDVVGELEGSSALCLDLRDAVRVGGVLIMLPESDLENSVAEEEFSEDTKAAFSEVANIISGIYTAIFAEQYHKSIRFMKTDLVQVAPLQVKVESPEPIADVKYYVNQMTLSLNGAEHGKLHFLLPAALFGLQDVDIEPGSTTQATVSSKVQAAQADSSRADAQPISSRNTTAIQPDILIISDDHEEGEKIGAVLKGMGFAVKLLSFKDNALNYIPGQLKAVFLVMREVDEQAFGIAIKINSASNLPLIAAGSGWTRTKVIKAVKYGVCDILLTPATADDIQEKATSNLMRMAA